MSPSSIHKRAVSPETKRSQPSAKTILPRTGERVPPPTMIRADTCARTYSLDSDITSSEMRNIGSAMRSSDFASPA